MHVRNGIVAAPSAWLAGDAEALEAFDLGAWGLESVLARAHLEAALPSNRAGSPLAAGITNFMAHQPPLPIAYGTHHSKAFLLQYASGMRVVVHTANYIYADCNNKSQGLYCQDFPLKGPGSPATSAFEKGA